MDEFCRSTTMKARTLSLPTFLKFSLFLALTVVAKERSCTASGHQCSSTDARNPDPCKSGDNLLKSFVCKNSTYIRGYCDYCPEMYDAAVQDAGSYRSGVTACRQEDGFYKCQFGGPDVNCVRRTWLRRIGACHIHEEMTQVKLNCTDHEMTCKLQNRCVERFEINTELGCDFEARKFYIRCHNDEFECKSSKKCIPREWVRDGTVDCSVYGEVNDTSDEKQQLFSCDPESEFRCEDGNGRCIPREMVMDGRPNCLDSSDEQHALECHNGTEFRCEFSGRCVHRYRVNDEFPDCPKGTDEGLSIFPCRKETEFDCGDGRCIPRSWVGNSLTDCRSGIDERTHMLANCSDSEFMCLDESRCLPNKFLCDGIKNCDDCSDEVELCEEARWFRCHNDPSVCIPWTHTCDKANDCSDGSDERTARDMQGFKCKNNDKTCYVPQFLLHTNVVSMCTENQDTCYDKEGKFVCVRCLDGKRIISRRQICDGVIDCGDLSDECPCQQSDASKLCEKVFNGSGLENQEELVTKMASVCNGTVDWIDEMDEMFCTGVKDTTQSSKVVKTAFDYRCKNLTDHVMGLAQRYGFADNVMKEMSFDAVKCDGNIECILFEDECSEECPQQPEFCSTIQAVQWPLFGSDGQVQEARACTNATTFYQSLIPQWLCDGLQHCNGGEDERNCEGRYYCDAGTNSNIIHGKKPVVSIEGSQRCDMKADCLDSSDELDCPEESHFYCEGGVPLFIARSRYLDQHADCRDYSDECPLERFDENPFSSPTELLSSIVLRVFIWIVAATSLFGNAWVIGTTLKELKELKKTREKNTSSYCNRVLVAHLATADFLTGVCLCILIIKSLQFSGEYCLHDADWTISTTCSWIGVLLVISSQTSLNIILTLTGIRLYSVLKPLKAKTMTSHVYYLLASLSWFVSVVMAIYPIVDVENFSSVIKIRKNAYFQSTVINRSALDRYYKVSTMINANFSTLLETEELFPERQVHVAGVYGYYSTNSVCFPNYFDSVDSKNPFSFCVILYNACAIVYICVSYMIFYKTASAKSSATGESARVVEAHEKRSERLRRRITLLVITTTLCWLPICLMAFYNLVFHNLPEVTYVIAAVVMLPIDSCFNPIIYSQVHRKVFKAVRRRLHRAE